MSTQDLGAIYRDYIHCLNTQDWQRLNEFVDDTVEYNGEMILISGYQKMLERDFDAIPDLQFTIDILCSDPPFVASRLMFDCTPKSELFGIFVNGRRVRFSENVFYEFHSGRIQKVRSLIDYSAIARQVGMLNEQT